MEGDWSSGDWVVVVLQVQPFEIGGIPPIPRFGHTATVIDRSCSTSLRLPAMVVVGGASNGYDLLRSGDDRNDVHVLEMSEDTFAWREIVTQGTSRSTGRCHSSVRVCGEKLPGRS